MPIEVSQLNYYPVKSCAGIGLTTAQIGTRGIEHDREWAILDAHSHDDMLNQTKHTKFGSGSLIAARWQRPAWHRDSRR